MKFLVTRKQELIFITLLDVTQEQNLSVLSKCYLINRDSGPIIYRFRPYFYVVDTLKIIDYIHKKCLK
jgi:hypothetical protein